VTRKKKKKKNDKTQSFSSTNKWSVKLKGSMYLLLLKLTENYLREMSMQCLICLLICDSIHGIM